MLKAFPEVSDLWKRPLVKCDQTNVARKNEFAPYWAASPRLVCTRVKTCWWSICKNAPGCQECVKACADSHDDVTRLVLEGNRFNEFLVPSSCRSCHDPACLVGCPVDAIHRKSGNSGENRGNPWRLSLRITALAVDCAPQLPFWQHPHA